MKWKDIDKDYILIWVIGIAILAAFILVFTDKYQPPLEMTCEEAGIECNEEFITIDQVCKEGCERWATEDNFTTPHDYTLGGNQRLCWCYFQGTPPTSISWSAKTKLQQILNFECYENNNTQACNQLEVTP